MHDVILFVFEGEKTEPQIFKSLETHYFNCDSTLIRATYDAEIYQLWQKVANDDDLDMVEVVRERNEKNRKALEGISRHQVSQIFLFFDYDGHATNASDTAIKKMMKHFDNENDHGKLYVSYPMVEALKDIHRDTNFHETTFHIKSGTNYKNWVHNSSGFHNIKKYDAQTWSYLILENYKKANYLVRNINRKPTFRITKHLTQNRVFIWQRKKHIFPMGQVAVLSAFPFFIIEYFGEPVYKTL